MLSQVRRSRREIGLLLAVGTPPWNINSLVVAKAALVGVIGGGLGYLIGIPITTYFASSALEISLKPSSDLLPVALAIGFFTSTISAFIPAQQAANMDPVEVLREE